MSRRQGRIIQEWIELTLCNMLDEIGVFMQPNHDTEKIIDIVMRYSREIYNAQNHGK